MPRRPTPLPKISKARLAEGKIELHQARRAGDHLDLRIKIDDKVYDFAVVKTRTLPMKTGKVQRVQRTPDHSIAYFYTDSAVFGPGEYGEGTMKTQWRGNIHVINSEPGRIEFYIPEGQYKGRYCIRNINETTVILRMKEPDLPWKERMAFSSNEKKLQEVYNETRGIDPNKADYISQHKIDGANYMLIPGEKENVLISRRLSVDGKPINRADNIPWIKYHQFPKETHGEVIHVEVVARNSDISRTSGLLNSTPSTALQSQNQKPGNSLSLVAWDFSATNKPGKPYNERMELLRRYFSNRSSSFNEVDRRPWGFSTDRFLLFRIFVLGRTVEFPLDNVSMGMTIEEFAKYMKDKGHEGVVVKRKDLGYYEDVWFKDKRVMTGKYTIVGFIEGEGKHKGRLGALIVKDPNTGVESKVGTGFDDAEREYIWNNRKSIKGRKVLCSAHEHTPRGVMRGPRYEGGIKK